MPKRQHNKQKPQQQLPQLPQKPQSNDDNSVVSKSVNVIDYNKILESFSHEQMWNKWRKNFDQEQVEVEDTPEAENVSIADEAENVSIADEAETETDTVDTQEVYIPEKNESKTTKFKYVEIPNLNRLSFTNWLNKIIDDDGTRINDICNEFIRQHLKYINNQNDINLYDTRFQFINGFKYFLYINSSAKITF
jgi:hypothetical protein